MKLQCKWNEKMKFTAEADGHHVFMDAKSPIGGDSAMTPKHLLLAGISGCTAMEVVFAKLNTESFPDAGHNFQIRGIPIHTSKHGGT